MSIVFGENNGILTDVIT